MTRKSIPPKVYFGITVFFCVVSILIFMSPLVLGLLVYYDAYGIGTEAAKYFVQKIGYDPTYNIEYSGGADTIENYYYSLRTLIGMGLLTFTPLSLYGLVIGVCWILGMFGICFNEDSDAAFIGMILAALLAIAMAVVYWWRICQPVVAYSSTVMSAAGKPMHWGYRWLFYLFPVITISIQAIAILLGSSLAEKLGLEDILIVYPIFSLFGVAIGGGLIALMYFALVKIIIFLASILGFLIIFFAIISIFSPSQAYYTDGIGKTRKYHETFFKDAYIDEKDAESGKEYKGY